MPIDFTNKKWTISALKAYLRQNGQDNLNKKNKAELIQLAVCTEKAKALEEEENSVCSGCNKNIDGCDCERCNNCYEILNDCFCVEAKERRAKIQQMKALLNPIANVMNQFKQAQQPQQQAQPQTLPLTEKNIKKFTETTKSVPTSNTNTASTTSSKTRKVKIKKKVEKPKTVVSIDLDSIKEERDEIDIETELQISALKIKIKLFISEKIENKKSVQSDVFDLLELILLKYKIKLLDEEKKVFPRIFQRVYKENKETQKKILKDIVIYLVECDSKSFESL